MAEAWHLLEAFSSEVTDDGTGTKLSMGWTVWKEDGGEILPATIKEVRDRLKLDGIVEIGMPHPDFPGMLCESVRVVRRDNVEIFDAAADFVLAGDAQTPDNFEEFMAQSADPDNVDHGPKYSGQSQPIEEYWP